MPSSSEFRGFDVVRRGYDRRQVDLYLKALSVGQPPAEPASFDIAGRGYDSGQVDRRIKELLADGGML
jgi:hypothetical protein